MDSHPACFFVSSNRPNQNRSSSFYYAAPALGNNLFHQSFIGLLLNNGFDSIDHWALYYRVAYFDPVF